MWGIQQYHLVAAYVTRQDYDLLQVKPPPLACLEGPFSLGPFNDFDAISSKKSYIIMNFVIAHKL